MFLFALLSFIFAIFMVFLILIVLIQKGKGSLGIGNLGGGNQMLFGGSGGQDLFQKITWGLGAILIFGSLGLAVWKTKIIGVSTSLLRQNAAPIERQLPEPDAE
jgi:protein translocase SecG subunit